MNRKQALAFLTKEGNLDVPCSRYGNDSSECAKVAWRVAKNLEYHNGDPITEDSLDAIMSLVVNDHDDVSYILREYKIPRHKKETP